MVPYCRKWKTDIKLRDVLSLKWFIRVRRGCPQGLKRVYACVCGGVWPVPPIFLWHTKYSVHSRAEMNPQPLKRSWKKSIEEASVYGGERYGVRQYPKPYNAGAIWRFATASSALFCYPQPFPRVFAVNKFSKSSSVMGYQYLTVNPTSGGPANSRWLPRCHLSSPKPQP